MPVIRTNRPVPFTVRFWVPPAQVVVEKTVVNGPFAAGATWIWNDRANAVSQLRVTPQTVVLAPRSTCTHCGSLNALDQRVPGLPSTALPAGKEAFSVEDAVAGRPSAAFAVPQTAAPARSGVTARYATSRNSTARAVSSGVRRNASGMAGLLTLPGAAGPGGLARSGTDWERSQRWAIRPHGSTPRPGEPATDVLRCRTGHPPQSGIPLRRRLGTL